MKQQKQTIKNMCIILSLCFCNVWAEIQWNVINDLRQEKNIINGQMIKDNNGNYIGKVRVSGVLVWELDRIQDADGWTFKALKFIPDKNVLFDEMQYGYFTLCRDDDEKFSQAHKCNNTHINKKIASILGKEWQMQYALCDFVTRADITLFDFMFFETDFIEEGIKYVLFEDLVLNEDMKRIHYNKTNLQLVELSYGYKDSYINLRESPNGKILARIQKTDMAQCNKIDENKGIIIGLGIDSSNFKWLKVAYIPPNAKDTSGAIYGVIHES